MADKNCHSCRRRRLRCDRALPACRKCALTGVECLGYERLILWNKGVASRGKMMGKTFDVSVSQTRETGSPSEAIDMDMGMRICTPLIDPLLQDLGSRYARYIYHFDQTFCKEIVIYDIRDQNPVRQLLAYLSEYPMLREVFVATSACHLYHLSPVHARSNTVYRDALVAKHKALRLLNDAIVNLSTADIDLIIAAILVLMYLEFLDSGTDVWRIHLEGAKRLINCLRRQEGTVSDTETVAISSPAGLLRRWLVSELLVFDIIGSTISKSIPLTPSIYGIEDGFDVSAILATAETNNFASCPAQLLQCLLTLVQLSEVSYPVDHSDIAPDSDSDSRMNTPTHGKHPDPTAETVKEILRTVRSFVPFDWALSVQSLSPCQDLHQRTWIASAYQAAICLYAMRVLPSQKPESCVNNQILIPVSIPEGDPEESEREHLVSTIATQLSKLDPDSGLFKSSIWPSFIAGAEAKSPELRRWAWLHLAAVSRVLPYKTSTFAMDVLVLIWGEEGAHRRGWIEMARSLGADFFVA
ncbi:hypothetical protein P170DRAFT_462445 [Aspergillus steynii IBT 23096]|uniref:Zn(2)-C6 fungal-type domain-containing protein n=1 Tax=Aspergillus steynii IBT 23096 TaxID=1392250 RepID=A0A2I2GI21_9EURO|nr:uncharacterized protein P170DRAFT_462445 [Aspergillus steynii IBT 23096]PLB52528.1 hypothetical protein P170DRAFT_462445 [Aspergillus steynii IBT 23096]